MKIYRSLNQKDVAATENGKCKMGKTMNVVSIHAVAGAKDRTGSGVLENGNYPGRMIKKFCFLIPVIFSLITVHSFAYQEKELKEEKPPPALTEEEREMLEDREMLENLALLKNLDAIAFLDLLNEMDPEWSERDVPVLQEEKPEKEPAEKKEEQ